MLSTWTQTDATPLCAEQHSILAMIVSKNDIYLPTCILEEILVFSNVLADD
jgi:hypothetical protein